RAPLRRSPPRVPQLREAGSGGRIMGRSGEEVSRGAAPEAPASPNVPARWPVFLCYRQTDGRPTAEGLYGQPNNRSVTEHRDQLAALEVYLDRRAPASKDWREIHRPALERARCLIVIITPGLFSDFGPDDWVHRELNWWLKNRRTAPVLVETSGEGERWV